MIRFPSRFAGSPSPLGFLLMPLSFLMLALVPSVRFITACRPFIPWVHIDNDGNHRYNRYRPYTESTCTITSINIFGNRPPKQWHLWVPLSPRRNSKQCIVEITGPARWSTIVAMMFEARRVTAWRQW